MVCFRLSTYPCLWAHRALTLHACTKVLARQRPSRPLMCLLALLSVVCAAVVGAQTPAPLAPTHIGAPALLTPSGNPLPLPSTLPLAEFEKQLFAFLQERHYKKLGWKRDKGIRDTGPFVHGQYYGNHTAVTIYYSPEIIAWLENGRRAPVPQNAMIIKEMYQPPAAQYYKDHSVTFRTTDLIPDAEQQKLLQAWTIMIKDATVAKDGWFWGSVPVGKQAQEQAIRFDQDPFTTGPWTGCTVLLPVSLFRSKSDDVFRPEQYRRICGRPADVFERWVVLATDPASQSPVSPTASGGEF
jgi:hypothetical protein